MVHRSRPRRTAAAAVELAILLPFLAFLFVLAVDFARVFYFSLTLANCARNGAIYESDPYERAESPYKSVQEAALADAPDLNAVTITSATVTGSDGNTYVEVTAAYQFQTVSQFPGVPNSVNLTRTVRMRMAPANPSTN